MRVCAGQGHWSPAHIQGKVGGWGWYTLPCLCGAGVLELYAGTLASRKAYLTAEEAYWSLLDRLGNSGASSATTSCNSTTTSCNVSSTGLQPVPDHRPALPSRRRSRPPLSSQITPSPLVAGHARAHTHTYTHTHTNTRIPVCPRVEPVDHTRECDPVDHTLTTRGSATQQQTVALSRMHTTPRRTHAHGSPHAYRNPKP